MAEPTRDIGGREGYPEGEDTSRPPAADVRLRLRAAARSIVAMQSVAYLRPSVNKAATQRGRAYSSLAAWHHISE